MKFEDLLSIYKRYRLIHGNEVYRYISQIFKEAKTLHKKDWESEPTPNMDHEQSWRAFKGKNFEKLILHMIRDHVENLGLKILEGNKLERMSNTKKSEELSRVRRNLLIHFGDFGSHLPDVDLIIYDPMNYKILCVVSSKITLRERVAQTGYWKLKLSSDKVTRDIKVFFITPDEDETLITKNPPKKGRAIVEIDTDGCYVMTEKEIEESDKVKNFGKFFEDLRKIANKFKR